MHFFVARKPDSVTFRVLDDDSNNVGLGEKDDALGEATLEIGDLFEAGGSFEGELPLEKGKGSIVVHLKCRVMRPIETEVKLSFAEMQIAGKEKEKEATVRALDESELLREDAIQQLGATEQEVSIRSESRPGSALRFNTSSRPFVGGEKSTGTRGETEAASDRALCKREESFRSSPDHRG